jgi:hypothetical protein
MIVGAIGFFHVDTNFAILKSALAAKTQLIAARDDTEETRSL